MADNNNSKNYCKMQPDNMGLQCMEPYNSQACKRCGWNAAEAQRRRNETIKKIKERAEKEIKQ